MSFLPSSSARPGVRTRRHTQFNLSQDNLLSLGLRPVLRSFNMEHVASFNHFYTLLYGIKSIGITSQNSLYVSHVEKKKILQASSDDDP